MVINLYSMGFLSVFPSNYRKYSVEVSELDGVHDDAKATEKDAALHLALSRLSSEFARESTSSSQQLFEIRRVPVTPTGSLKLDVALGIGGLPKVSHLLVLLLLLLLFLLFAYVCCYNCCCCFCCLSSTLLEQVKEHPKMVCVSFSFSIVFLD